LAALPDTIPGWRISCVGVKKAGVAEGVAELEKKSWVQPAELKKRIGKNWAKIRWAKKI